MLAQPGLYIHFPWCVKKCPYCDFNSHPLFSGSGKGQDFDAYLAHLLADFDSQTTASAVSGAVFSSVFFGGGTPSLFAPEHFAALLEHLPLAPDAEITMEANPGTTEHADFGDYLAAGINRLSIGAQSFDDAQLGRLGRIHNSREIIDTYHQAVDGGFDNINLDLMWALPQQSVDQCLADLEAAIQLAPQHLSWYQLTIEAKTEFARRPPLLPVEDAVYQMEIEGNQLLAEQGYARYEVSAFARDGRTCRHNLNYWQFGDYLGVGAGAHGKVSTPEQIYRTRKPHQPRVYQQQPTDISRIAVNDQDLLFEFMLNALRLVDGVPVTELQKKTRLDFAQAQDRWSRLADQELVYQDRIACTPLGFRYLDSVVAEFVPRT